MNIYLKCLIYLVKHKLYVFKECYKMGIIWRGIVHDFSKLYPSEFIAYAKYFYGKDYLEYVSYGSQRYEFDCWSFSKEGIEEKFNLAWLFHQHRNRHHWQYWLLRMDDGSTVAMDMPITYIQEMVCDWTGAGLAITGKREVKEWYQVNKDKMVLSTKTRNIVELLLGTI